MIRAAAPADRPVLRTLQSLLPEASPALLTAAVDGPGLVLVSVDERAEEFTETRPPVGYVLATTGPETAHVAEIVVAPAFRREGRGRRLLAAALARLRETDATAVELAVEPGNEAARRLYESFGFVETERVAEYYEDGGAAVRMRRPL